MAYNSYAYNSYGLYSYGIYSYGIYSYSLNSCGTYSYYVVWSITVMAYNSYGL